MVDRLFGGHAAQARLSPTNRISSAGYPTARMLLVAEDVLLLQRAAESKFAPLHWDLPSGKTDKGESVTAAATRELKEETGLTVDPAALKVAGIIHGAWGVKAPNGFLTVIFAARSWQGEPVNSEPRKHAQVDWFPVSQVPAQLVPDRREALLGYLRSAGEPVVSTDGFWPTDRPHR